MSLLTYLSKHLITQTEERERERERERMKGEREVCVSQVWVITQLCLSGSLSHLR